MINLDSIGKGIIDFGKAFGAGATDIAIRVGDVAIKALNQLPLVGESISAAAATLPAWAVGGITLVAGALLLTGTVLLVTKVIIPLFHKSAEEA